ncbi:hypothetical protein KP696_01325 [Nocardia seriolae]|uniref:RNA methyltransferase n=2 Tax=Nocardia seriolae TaxID=37332 RepID=A0ABC9YVD5_9NOCA|nr:hypothetical protein [Nocardia seriolae]PSK30006.1 hypothetical protein C6575_17905 [Nocardia seriolae]QOW36391.1 hypothetical protein IMZ23_16920 [Nocardia seriolae]QUN16094.1 hypothetical protein KEC46_27985 [Nocardia seriolae]BAW08159.1 RNA methyltransferase [Nocardia seriolae]
MSADWYGRILEVRLGPPGHGGFCVARHEGRVLFVRHGLPGELVRAQITEDRGGSFCRAEAVEILDPSPDRVPATCPVSGPGGAGCCDFTFATPAAQRDLKHQVVAEQLRRLADWEPDFTVETIPAPSGLPSGVVAQLDTASAPGPHSDSRGGGAGRITDPADARGHYSMPSPRLTGLGRIGGVPTGLASALLAGSASAGAERGGPPPDVETAAASTAEEFPGAAPAPGRIGGVATHFARTLVAHSEEGGASEGADSAPGIAAGARPAPADRTGTSVAPVADSSSVDSSSGAAVRPSGGARVVLREVGADDPSFGVLSVDAYSGGWRSRVRLTVDAAGRAGVHRYRSTEVIADLRCPQPMAGAMDGIGERKWTPGADLVVAVDGEGMRHVVEVAPAAGDRDDHRGRGGDRRGRGVGAAGRRGGGDRSSTAARRAAAHGAREERVIDGTGTAVQYVAERRWELSATGFWQPHYGAAQCYSDVVAEWADAAPGALVWDLYCGVGVFAARLAEQVGERGVVHGVEFARGAVTEGRAALRDMPWVDLTVARVERWIHEQPGAAPDVVVLDPPRAGAGKEVINALTERSPRRIIHIGCDPAAFARDIGLYRGAGYEPAGLRVFDAFPGTYHVECIALLER